MKLSERIRENRIRCGLSQEQLAEKMEVSRQAVTKWESGQSAPSTEKLFKLAEIFGTTVDLLLPAERVQEKKPRFHSTGALIMIVTFLGLFLLARIFCSTEPIHSLRYWLFHYEVGRFTYLYGWLLSQGLWWYSMAICVAAAFLGKSCFAWTSFGGFTAGFVLGELLGPFPPGAEWGQGHYGWAIWGGVFLFSMLLGGIGQHMRSRGVEVRSKRGAIWLTLWILGITIITALILISRQVPTGH